MYRRNFICELSSQQEYLQEGPLRMLNVQIFTAGGQGCTGWCRGIPQGYTPSHKGLKGLETVFSQLVIIHITVLNNQRNYLLQVFSWERQSKQQ